MDKTSENKTQFMANIKMQNIPDKNEAIHSKIPIPSVTYQAQWLPLWQLVTAL